MEYIESKAEGDKNTTCNVEDLLPQHEESIYDYWDTSEISFEIVWLECEHVQLKFLPPERHPNQQPEWVYLTNYGRQLQLATEKEFDQKREDYLKKTIDYDNLLHDFGYYTTFQLLRVSEFKNSLWT